MKWKILFTLCLLTTSFVATGRTQSPDPGETFEKEIIVDGPGGGPELAPGPGDFVFLSSEFGGEDRTVKGAPYSAESVTERTQILQDGNRIVQKNSAQVYRDSDGRTRREQQFGPLGMFAGNAEPHRSVFIHDPVKGTHYVLEPDDQTARKMVMHWKHEGPHPPKPEDAELPPDVLMAPGPGPHRMEFHGGVQFFAKPGDAKTETLGKQIMEGMDVEGTRTTSTIPEGQIGNERPIEVVTEKWYSPELQVNVMTRHTDPRFGVTTFQLRNISRVEPDKSLFKVPAGYKIEEGPAGDRIIIKKKIKE